MNLAPVAMKLARNESLTPEDVALVQSAIQQYGVTNTSKMLDATVGGLKQAVAPAQAMPTQGTAAQEEAAMNQAFGAQPVRRSDYGELA